MIHLHCHSMFSTLDGLGDVTAMVARAKDIGASALAITDHASINALPELFKAAQEAGIQPLIGCEFYVVEDASINTKGEARYHLTVWAKSWRGVLSIMEHLTVASAQLYYRPRLSWSQALDFEDCVIGTACAFGILAMPDYGPRMVDLIRAYGKENLVLEVMPHSFDKDGVDAQRVVNERAVAIAREVPGLRLVATNDAHYVQREDAATHDVLLAVQSGKLVDDPTRWRFGGDNLYLRTREEMAEAFGALGYLDPATITAALDNPASVVAQVNVVMPPFEATLPSPYPAEVQPQARFMELLMAGWKRKASAFGENLAAYQQRLVYEVGVIAKLGFTNYFLIVEDIIRWSRSQGIMVGPARGSSAGSLVCFLLDITQVDPLKHGLFFERFLNPERIDLPDIDVDFQDDRRGEVFHYIAEKYGRDRVAHINTFGYLTVKSAFRDVARVHGVNTLRVNTLSKQIEDVESFDKVPELAAFAKERPEVVRYAKALDGVVRQVGVHACGMVVSERPLAEVAVVETRKDQQVVNWDKVQAEAFGLLKIDVLGLSTLTILNRARMLIQQRRGVTIEFTELPLDDPDTLAAFSRGEGVGVFQFENGGMQSLLRSLEACDFGTITDTTALFRPGSLNSGQTDLYVRIARGDEYEHYPCEALRTILGPTKGVLVYQEQIMQIFNQLAGFSWAEADKMRKIIGKKLGREEFDKHREHFMAGCAESGVSAEVAADLFDKMAEFAAYSFNKSHAVAYTIISVWSMYLKVHYPVEFLAAVLSSVTDNDRMPVFAAEAKRLGIALRPPSLNASQGTYTVLDDHTLVAPFGCIKGVGERAVEEILKARQDTELGVFLSVADFQERVNRRVVNVRVMDTLRRAGVFEELGEREADSEVRAKNFAELLPFWSALPHLSVSVDKLDTGAVAGLIFEGQTCATEAKRPYLKPKMGSAKVPIMIINNPVKGEIEHLTSDGTRFLMKTLKGLGIGAKMVYYTSPLKCAFPKGAVPPTLCEAKCGALLKREIEAVKPKLVVCFGAGPAMTMLGGDGGMAKNHGRVVYNRELDTYVLFSYSPQYAFYQEGKLGEFQAAMVKIREIFYDL